MNLKNTFVFQAVFQPPRLAEVREGQGYLQHGKGLIHPLTSYSAKLGNAIGLFCINKQEC